MNQTASLSESSWDDGDGVTFKHRLNDEFPEETGESALA